MEYSRVTMHPLAQIRQNLLVIRERYGVARIGIFGSVARNEETPASDIDIPVEFREGEETFDTRTWRCSSSGPSARRTLYGPQVLP